MTTYDPSRSYDLLRPGQVSSADDARIRGARDITSFSPGQLSPSAVRAPEIRPDVTPPKGFLGRFLGRGENKGLALAARREELRGELIDARERNDAARRKAAVQQYLFDEVVPLQLEALKLDKRAELVDAGRRFNETITRFVQQQQQAARDNDLGTLDHLAAVQARQNKLLKEQIETAVLQARLSGASGLGTSQVELEVQGNHAGVAERRARTSQFMAKEDSYRPKPQPPQGGRGSSGYSPAMEEERTRTSTISRDEDLAYAEMGKIMEGALLDRREMNDQEWRRIMELRDSLARATDINRRKAAADFTAEK